MLSGIVTAVLMACFLGIVFWAYSGRRKRSFDEAAAMPLIEDRHHEENAR